MFWRIALNTGEWDSWAEVGTDHNISTTKVTTAADVSRIYFRTTSAASISSETESRRNDMVFSITDLKVYTDTDAAAKISEWTE